MLTDLDVITEENILWEVISVLPEEFKPLVDLDGVKNAIRIGEVSWEDIGELLIILVDEDVIKVGLEDLVVIKEIVGREKLDCPKDESENVTFMDSATDDGWLLDDWCFLSVIDGPYVEALWRSSVNIEEIS